MHRWLTFALFWATGLCAAAPAMPPSTWQDIVRHTPYWESQGVQANLETIRTWVLSSSGYCEEADRHILFDRRMRFVGYLSDRLGPRATQAQINIQRRRLAEEGKVDAWAMGSDGGIGYPFVLSCHQPDARLEELLEGYLGKRDEARLWGTWDGMRIGAEDATVSLHTAIRKVYQYRTAQGRIDLPESDLSVLAGKVIIESGGEREARSAAGARGIMQLSQQVLRDCRLPKRFYYHRLAQIDCALYLLQQNRRVLEPVFNERFGHLPGTKREALFRLLLVQAYHAGIGRTIDLLGGQTLGSAAAYFADHHQQFTAGDIALGLIFHNLGRDRLGFASLYYVTDVMIASRAACDRVTDLPGCGMTMHPSSSA